MRKFLLFLMLLFPCLCLADVSSSELKLVADVENYLNNISSFEADFTQYSNLDSGSTGKFYLKRPGRLRWEYLLPQEHIILINKNLITYFDVELDQVSYVSAEDNLASFLTRKEISLQGDIKIIEANVITDTFLLTIVQANKPKDGSLQLKLKLSPLKLIGLSVIDNTGERTIIDFNNIKENHFLDKDLFMLHREKNF